MRDWTSEQKRAIQARGDNLIVSAGAGSGKTAVMIERIRSLIKEGHDIRRMMVCTFTKTAATDMKRKLSEALVDDNDTAVKRQLGLLSAADISTLHSWCSRIIKAWFFDGTMDPEFTLLEEGEAAQLKARAAEEAIEKMRADGDDAFVGLYEAFRTNRNHTKLLDCALTVYDYSVAQPEPEKWLSRGMRKSDDEYRQILYAELDEARERLKKKARNLAIEHDMAGFTLDAAALEDLCGCMETWEKCTLTTPQLRKDKQFTDLHEKFRSLKKSWTELCSRRKKVDEMPDCSGSAKYCAALCSLVKLIGEIYTAYKRDGIKADYSDLEHEALRILGGSHGKEIVGAYDYVFVDEYQDISPLQEKILSFFDCEMFFVGDVKQSIYGFRMCSPDFFIDKRKRYLAGEGTAVDLTANFRSGGKILEAVNRVFESVMTAEFGGTEYSEAKMTAGLELPSVVSAVFLDDEEADERQIEPQVYSVKNDMCDETDTSLERRADAVVNEIIDMSRDRVCDNGVYRDVEFGDIAVLVRSRGRFTELLERKLRAESIPVTTVAGEESADGFATVSMLISYLRIIDNAHDDVNLSAVMLSPMFGKFCADELAEIRRSGDGAFCDCVFAAAQKANGGKLSEFVKDLNEFRILCAESTVSELAGEITAKYKCFNHALTIGGEREAAALDVFLEHLATQERDTLHDYLRYTDSCGTPKIKVTDGGKAVRIMTIHASKGLEFECVVLPEVDKRFNRSDVYASVICDADEGVVLRSFDFDNRSIDENARFAVCSSRLKRALAAEELRILYVAMTRAKYRLTMFAKKRNSSEEERDFESADTYLDWLYSVMESVSKKTATDVSSQRSEQRAEPDASVVKTLGARIEANERKRADALSKSGPVKASVSGVIHSDPDDAPEYPVLYSSDDRAAKKGSAYHKFMQWVNFGADGEWERLCARFPEEAETIGEGADLIAAFSKVGEFIGGRKFVREKAFVYNAEIAEDGNPSNRRMLIQGVIDLMVFNGDGTVDIVDYKTGDERNLYNPAYAKQLALYASAVQKALKVKVRKTYLYGFSCRKFIEIT